MTDMTPEQALRKLLATAEGNPFCPVGHLVEHGLGGADALRAALSRPAVPEGVIRDAANHLTNWMNMNWCECEGGHICGYNEVKRTRDALMVVAEQQPATDVAGLAEALEAIQKVATHKSSIRTGIHAAIALGCISAICNTALAAHQQGGEA